MPKKRNSILHTMCAFAAAAGLCFLTASNGVFAHAETAGCTVPTVRITRTESDYNALFKRAAILLSCEDFIGLDWKRSTITLPNLEGEQQRISLYDGRLVSLDGAGNVSYGEYNTAGFIEAKMVGDLLFVYIAARQSTEECVADTSIQLPYTISLMNTAGNETTASGMVENRYIDYHVMGCSASAAGAVATLSFDARNTQGGQIVLPVYRAGTYTVGALDYYGNTQSLTAVLDAGYDKVVNVEMAAGEKAYQPITLTLTAPGYSIAVSEAFFEDVHLSQEDIFGGVENEYVDLSGISCYADSYGNYRFHEGTIYIRLEKGMKLFYNVDSGAYEDFDYYTEHSYLIDGQRSIAQWDEHYEYTATEVETLAVSVIEGSPILSTLSLEGSGYLLSPDALSVQGNGTPEAIVTVYKNTSFLYKYTDYNGAEVIKSIVVDSILSPQPKVCYNAYLPIVDPDATQPTYLYGELTARIEDEYFTYVDKDTGLPLSYTFTPNTATTYTFDKDSVKILLGGEETGLTLAEDIVIELPQVKLYDGHVDSLGDEICDVCGESLAQQPTTPEDSGGSQGSQSGAGSGNQNGGFAGNGRYSPFKRIFVFCCVAAVVVAGAVIFIIFKKRKRR